MFSDLYSYVHYQKRKIWFVSHDSAGYLSFMKSILDGLKTDLGRAKKGKPPLKDADGKRKKNLTPEA